MSKIIVGQILKNDEVVGTGFLVSPDIVMTAKHNLVTVDEIYKENFKEKEVIFRFNKTDAVSGCTINLVEAIDKGIDCVYIRLEEVLSDKEIPILVENENSIKDYSCSIVGYPKLSSCEMSLEGTIVSEGDEIYVWIKKEDRLQEYQGLSGAPLIISGNVIGIIIIQENTEQLKALSTKYIIKNLSSDALKSVKRDIPNCLFDIDVGMTMLKSKVEQIMKIVGPRYSKKLNVKTSTYSELSFILNKDSVKDMLSKVGNKIGICINKLNDAVSNNENTLIKQENKNTIYDIIDELQKDSGMLCPCANEDELKRVLSNLKGYINKLEEVFQIEKTCFEEKYGEGTYNNKSWRGFMASHMCSFPAQYLDSLKEAKNLLQEIGNIFDIDLIRKANSRAILILGRGGIGKTHLLCDIVNKNLNQNLPAVLILGELFMDSKTADEIIMNWYKKDLDFDVFLEWLNEVGEQNNVYIPVCIDAINEAKDEEYWNINIPLLLAKVEKYKNIKVIFSCRSIYAKEYLDDDKLNNLLQIDHNGFDKVEEEALDSFCKYYGVKIDYETVGIPEFMNPLFLKMLCEIAKERNNKTVIVNDIENLMNDFFKVKNKIISRAYADDFSVRDNIVQKVLINIINYMIKKEQYIISWIDLKKCVADTLEKFEVSKKIYTGFTKMLLSENLLKESGGEDYHFSFAYQKFYEYLYSKKYDDRCIHDIVNDVENNRITLGTLEMIQISYFRKYKQEFLSKLNGKIHEKAVESFVNGLYWRNQSDMNDNTVAIFEQLMTSSEKDVRRAIEGLISIATKNNCILNAHYIHNKLKVMNNIKRDYFLSSLLLKQYDKIKVLSDICERAILLQDRIFPEENVLLWKIILCWGTGSNDTKLRDKASKGLVNLFRLYPDDMLEIVKLFSDIDDDYVQERVWQSIYSTIVLLQKETYAITTMNYILKEIVNRGKWSQNVLIRNYLRNIFEYSLYKGWCTEDEVILVRPPYKSNTHDVNKEFIAKHKEEYSKLYWNCQDSDFAVYTIPSEVRDYGISKKDVGLMIFEDILKCGYTKKYKEYDKYIDYTYGSLRNRDEQVERIGKKYQKIYLYREMGNIYDNYKYSPQDEDRTALSEQGNMFRNIDLTILNQKNTFQGTKLEYPFYRYAKWNDIKWFENNDVKPYITKMMVTKFEGKEYYILHGHIYSKEYDKKDFRDIWMQFRTYFYLKEKKDDLLNWFDGKDFEGRWMPEGGVLYECCLGEFPWSSTIANYYKEESEQDFGQEKPAPCHLISTVTEYNNEKDSEFCTNEHSLYMLPSKYLFEHMNLVWDGKFGYYVDGKIVIVTGNDTTIFIDKEFLINFLNKNNLDIVWTILGEKQKMTGLIGKNHPGRSEFSYTYYINEKSSPVKNHEVYNIRKPI